MGRPRENDVYSSAGLGFAKPGDEDLYQPSEDGKWGLITRPELGAREYGREGRSVDWGIFFFFVKNVGEVKEVISTQIL